MDDGSGIHEEYDVNKPSQWFAKNTQQAVMSRASILPVIARTGPTSKSGRESETKKTGSNTFIVGESEVGGEDRVGGTP